MSKTSSTWAIAAAFLAGIFIALQSRINGGLGLALEDGISAALFSFTSGWLLIGAVFAANKESRAGLLRLMSKVRSRELPLWFLLGGTLGGFLVMTQGVAAGYLGIALFTVAVVAGQSLSAITIDSRGLLGTTKRPLSLFRAVGAALVLLGVGLVVEDPDPKTIGLVLLPLIAGLGLGFQQAANGRVRIESESAIAATFLNFATGSLFLLILKIVTLPATGLPTEFPPHWWLYLGGVVGVIFIAIQVITVSQIGVLSLGVLLGTGQLLGSLLIDIFLPVPGQAISLQHFVGVGIAIVGALLVNLKR